MMRNIAVALSLLSFIACGGGPHTGVSAVPGHGAIAITVSPNPIVAHHVSGDTYEFPFDVGVRETGGHMVNVTRVNVTVFAPGGFNVGSQNWDADAIRAMGYPTSVNASGELHYHFSPRKSVSDERLFNGVSAELRVDAIDDTGASTSASTAVTVRKE